MDKITLVKHLNEEGFYDHVLLTVAHIYSNFQFSFGNNMRKIKKFKTKYQRCSPMASYVQHEKNTPFW